MSDDPRVATVREHMRLDNAHGPAGCIGRFTRLEREVIADGGVLDGADRVNTLSEIVHICPDLRFIAHPRVTNQ